MKDYKPCIYNGTHPFLEMSEEEFQQHEPASCTMCGDVHQIKNMHETTVEGHAKEFVCKDCYKG